MRRFFFVLTLAACGPSLPKATTTPARVDLSWKTMRADHRVSLDVTKSDGTHDQRHLRGALAAERPGKFRLRALGPGGIALFDLLVVDGHTKVMEAIRDPKASALGAVIQSLAGDLSAALLLDPAPPGRAFSTANEVVTIKESDRTVRLSRFVELHGRALPMRIEVDNTALHYRVAVEVADLQIDVPLDPALFAE